VENGGIDEGLEAGELDGGQAHARRRTLAARSAPLENQQENIP
jgi:hypothetical protein